MRKLHLLLTEFFDKTVLERPKLVLLCLLAALSFLGYQAKDFKLDASTETLVLETVRGWRDAKMIKSRYWGHDYVLMTYAPQEDLFSDPALENLTRLRNDL